MSVTTYLETRSHKVLRRNAIRGRFFMAQDGASREAVLEGTIHGLIAGR
jgi:hypothetical protein